MTVYHETATPTDTRATAYDYVVHPPIGRLLNAIADNCAVGGTFQPGVRGAADELGYSSAGTITSMLRQLAREGWILYDGPSGCITLLRDPREVISPTDQGDPGPPAGAGEGVISPTDQISATDHYPPESAPISPTDRTSDCTPESAPISRTDRVEWRPDATQTPISPTDRSASRMVDHVLAAAESESRSAAAKYNLPCAAKLISRTDRVIWHPDAASESPAGGNSQKSPDSVEVGAALAALGADEQISAEIIANHPDLSSDALADQWRKALDRERDGYTDNARALLFGTLRKPGGWLNGHATDGRAVDWSVYARDQADRTGVYAAGPPPATADAERDGDSSTGSPSTGSGTGQAAPPLSPHDRARSLLPEGASGRDFVFLVQQLAAGATDDQALDALALRARPGALRAGGVR